MGRRSRTVETNIPPGANVTAAAGAARTVGQYFAYGSSAEVERAETVPTLTRALNLLVSIIGGLRLEQFSSQWTGEDLESVKIPPERWMNRPDPRMPRQFTIGATVADLFWHGRAFWYVTSRYKTGYPAAFTWLPANMISTPGQAGPHWFGPADVVQFNGTNLDISNVVQFVQPTPGVLFTGARMIEIAIRLDQAAKRSAYPLANGYLQQQGGEPMDATELGELAADWASARGGTDTTDGTAVGALNEYVTFKEFTADPSKFQLTEGREYSALELSRVAQVPPFLLGISTGGMTYQNAQEAMKQLYVLGARPIMATIAETLSLDSILPNGRFTMFDTRELTEYDDTATADQAPAAVKESEPA